ncbi:competence protein CoiA [Bradyrhizobium japonicum]|uniref:competence protein CoiA n=1 Tax=Bradyrhizobium japonicum TaxID=375 RepID=UPI0027154F9C|nr:competence protein CoiA family protein [Bradyrhizobium japonicum]WLB57432.1 competence protein CoiA family protein [Bradyrhizobium japonicum]
MKYALASGQRVEAFAGGRATCLTCNGEVIAKCGSYRIHHWAHQGIRDCDSWAEKETEWHRAWKNKFPAECQEFIQHNLKSGERHIADVRTSHGLVIEFQHSHLDPPERIERESFYGNMLWVVDGTRLRRDYPRFVNNAKNSLRETNNRGYFLTGFPDECFPPLWLDSSAPVIFDFRVWDESQPPDVSRDTLWCLLPGRAEGSAVVMAMAREQFVDVVPTWSDLLWVQKTVAGFAQRIRESRAQSSFLVPRSTPFGGGFSRRSRRF